MTIGNLNVGEYVTNGLGDYAIVQETPQGIKYYALVQDAGSAYVVTDFNTDYIGETM